MLYIKNIPGWERLVRIIMAAGMLGYAILNRDNSTLALGVGAAGVMIAMTGFVGFCPMCAMVGRRLHGKSPK